MSNPYLTKMLTGFRLMDGQQFNNVVDQVNNLGGNGTPSALTASGATLTGATTLSGTLTVVPQLILAAGATQGSATAITSLKAIITATATSSAKGVRLPTASTGLEVIVGNAGTTFACKVYPATNGKIGAASTNSADSTTLAINKVNRYVAVNTTKWIVQRGA